MAGHPSQANLMGAVGRFSPRLRIFAISDDSDSFHSKPHPTPFWEPASNRPSESILCLSLLLACKPDPRHSLSSRQTRPHRRESLARGVGRVGLPAIRAARGSLDQLHSISVAIL